MFISVGRRSTAKKLSIIACAFGLYVILAAVWVGSYLQQQQDAHEAQLQQLTDRALINTQAGLETRLLELSRSIDLFARTNLTIINELLQNPDVESPSYGQLLQLLRSVYPDVVSFTLATAAGDPILEVFPGLIGPPCKADIKLFAKNPDGNIKRLHPNMKLSHFDVMTHLDTGAASIVFFASFLTPIITSSLKKFSGDDVDMMLLHREVAELIEFTEAGARGDYRRNWRLQAEEKSSIKSQVDIEGSRWTLVAMPNPVLTTEAEHLAAKTERRIMLVVVITGILWLVLTTLLVNFIWYQFNRIHTRDQNLDNRLHHDSLTGLPNRLLLMARMKLVLEHVQRSGGRAAILFIDLDGFRRVNVEMGPAIGDRVLERAAASLTQLGSTDTVSRLAGDKFVVVLTDLKTQASTEQIAQQLLDAISDIQTSLALPVPITASIGVAFYPEDGLDTALLLEAAEEAMRRAKVKGGNCYGFYQPQAV
ncbi:GGDEF domain-containing protein [Neptuniibacter sp. CAU 1671]|nr:GGDEF domain-containing protein [Neptuniibacter sp. CAU 1671]